MSLLLDSTFEKIKQYLESEVKSNAVVEYLSPKELSAAFDFSLGKSHNTQEILEYIDSYLKYAVKTGNPQFLNQLFQGKISEALAGDMLAVATNSSMYTYEVSPLATMMEMELVKKMNTFSGFKNGDGTFSTGGSNSNLLGLLCGRYNHNPKLKSSGLFGQKPMTMFVSEKAHYSFQKAAFTLGLGTENLIRVKTDNAHRIIPAELEKAIVKAIENGKDPFFIAATAGTTEFGAFDPIDEMADIAKKYNCWFHVDGSWGGSIILSNNHRHLFNGIHKSDSFSWNAHKLMNVPLIASIFLVKDPVVLHNALSSSETEYIFHENENESCDLGVKSLQCGKRNDALKLWLAWKAIGDEAYDQKINALMGLAQSITNKIEAEPDLELLAPTQSLNINFRYCGKLPEGDLNKFNVELRNKLWHQGKTMVNYCHLGETISIRLVLANLNLTKADLDKFLQHFLTTAKALENERTLVNSNG
ncbi:MAG: glutamate decarboxylase [Bacteroidetes bacterium]|nr:glutamate decarboxylase [Bacteroidota bacterium]